MSYPEELLHFVWKYRLFNQSNLSTVKGEKLQIVNTGWHNHDSGPDFEGAKIRLDETLWVGNVEIHIRSSDWELHQHHLDRSYDSVILHIVAVHDLPVFRNDGTEIPVLEISDRISVHIFSNYQLMMHEMCWIPCEKIFNLDSPDLIKSWLSRLLIERMEYKTRQIGMLLQEFKGSWDDAFYISLAINFGFKINALPFELLARSLPRHLFGRYKDNLFQIEALIFGQAGFLNERHKESYPAQLQAEYSFLKKKHSLQTIDKYLWKFMRSRPGNFPTIRLAQFAALMSGSPHLFSKIIYKADFSEIETSFSNLPVNEYWKDHWHFEERSKPGSIFIGEESVSNLLINTIAVFLFAYGTQTGSAPHIEKGIEILENLKAENNKIIRKFIQTGFQAECAFDSQALLQLKKYYCDQKKCLSCGIGIKLLNQ